MWVFTCPLCKCPKPQMIGDRCATVEELGCDTCEKPSCRKLYGQEEYDKHLEAVHGIGPKKTYQAIIQGKICEVREL